MKRYLIVLLILSVSLTIMARAPLTFEERVKAQEAIERVYYNHRIWPKENPQPKPPFEKMVTKEQIEAKVTDYLKKCSALDQFWQRPIIASQLQAEMDRMAKGSKDPATLNELFVALNNDPYLIAECLARPVLADRLIRDWYANDERSCEESDNSFKKSFSDWWENEEPELEKSDIVETASFDFVAPRAETACTTEWRHSSLNDIVDGRLQHTAVWTGTEMIIWGGNSNSYGSRQDGGRYNPSTDTWITTSTGVNCPLDRKYHTAIWTGTEMIIWGGYHATPSQVYALNDGAKYNPQSDTWTTISSGSGCPTGRYYHTAVWTGAVMIVWGGYDGSSYLQTGGRYNPSTDSWEATYTGANCPAGRELHTAIWAETEMIVWGGGNSSQLNTGGRYNPSTNTWTTTSTGANCPSARKNHTAVWTNSCMIIWGGGYSTVVNTGGVYNPSTDTWTAMSTGTYCPSKRARHTAVWTGTEMIIWGGAYGIQDYQDGGRYSPSSNTWIATNTGTDCPSARGIHSAAWTGTEMIIWGGGSQSQGALNTGGRYNPTTDSWVATSGASTLAVRSNSTSIWDGVEMISWGGNSGDKYNPALDSWSSCSSGTYCPSPRTCHTAVWTGNEMIIWGGQIGSSTYTNTGGLYNPVSDSWIATSTSTGCPSNRRYHTAVWTGSQMIVWGGSTNTGGLYDPSMDTWQATSTGTNCPSSRSNHTAVWTGTEMIIWGGGNTNTGGRYNPVSNNWMTVSTETNCPAGRSYHTAVWTGTEMIVWGGYYIDISCGGGGYCILNDGGRYNPSINTWNTTSTGINCPFARYNHTAVWTGKDMIIWGGSGSNTGGLYTPSIDSWTATSTGAYCATARSYHTAVWTGSEMIVWGGVASGGIYAPPPVISGAHVGCTCCPNYLSTGIFSAYQWFKNGMEITGATGGTYGATEDGNYSVRATRTDGCTLDSSLFDVTFLQSPSPSPLSGDSNNTCPSTSVVLTAETGYEGYQWNICGNAIPGADSETYIAGAPGNYSVTVTGANGCPGTSVAKPVSITFCSTSEVSPKLAVYPSRIAKDTGSSTGYYLYFQKIDGVDGYNIYEGAQGSWYSHSGQPGNICSAAVTDLGTGEMRAEVTPSAGDHYYLVTAYSGAVEGPSGYDSSDMQIPAVQCSL